MQNQHEQYDLRSSFSLPFDAEKLHPMAIEVWCLSLQVSEGFWHGTLHQTHPNGLRSELGLWNELLKGL